MKKMFSAIMAILMIATATFAHGLSNQSMTPVQKKASFVNVANSSVDVPVPINLVYDPVENFVQPLNSNMTLVGNVQSSKLQNGNLIQAKKEAVDIDTSPGKSADYATAMNTLQVENIIQSEANTYSLANVNLNSTKEENAVSNDDGSSGQLSNNSLVQNNNLSQTTNTTNVDADSVVQRDQNLNNSGLALNRDNSSQSIDAQSPNDD